MAAEVQFAIGRTYLSLALLEQDEPHLEHAFEVWRQALGSEHADTLTAQDTLATLRPKQGQQKEAQRLFSETLSQVASRTRPKEVGDAGSKVPGASEWRIAQRAAP